MPEKIFGMNPGQNDFMTPTEALLKHDTVGSYDVPHMISWADTERDLSAWLGNAMQSNALNEVFRLERLAKQRLQQAEAAGDENAMRQARLLVEDWRRLTTSDHFYYMSTKYWADGDVHKYFSPYESPYDAYINYMNVLDNLRSRATN
jgi:alpha-amylase